MRNASLNLVYIYLKIFLGFYSVFFNVLLHHLLIIWADIYCPGSKLDAGSFLVKRWHSASKTYRFWYIFTFFACQNALLRYQYICYEGRKLRVL